MHPTDLQLLDGMRIALGRLESAVDGVARGRFIAQLNLALGELMARSTARPTLLRRACDEARALALRAGALLGPEDRHALQKLESIPQTSGATEALEHAYVEIKQVLVDCVHALSAGAVVHGRDEDWSRAVSSFFEEVAQHEAQVAVDSYAPLPPAERDDAGAFDAERLAAYFARPTRDRAAMKLIDAKSLYGGFSRQTILATLLDESNETRSVVIRKQLGGGLLGSACLTVAEEIPYLELSHRAGLPVPEVLWYEPDGEILGGDFIVLSKMPGVSLGTPVGASGEVDEGIVRQLAGTLAKLHGIDWSSRAAALCPASGLPADVEISAAEAAIAGCGAFERLLREPALGPLPTLEIILDWLKKHVPATMRRPMLSHGDIGFHNMMGEGGRLTALLDWETARLADPAKDVAMARNFITSFVPWNRFYGWYRDAGGPAIDDASLEYYTIYHSFAHLLVCEVALGARISQGSTPNLEYLQLGLPVRVYFSKKMLASCGRVWSR